MIPTLLAALRVDVTMAANFKTIEHAWAQEPVDVVTEQLPMCVIWSPNEVMGSNDADGQIVAQMVTRMIHIFCVCDYTVLDARLADIRNVVVAWQKTGFYDVTELVEGELIQINGDIVWWLDTYSTRVQLTSY